MDQKERDLKKMSEAKKQYEQLKMSEQQLEGMKQKISEAKKEKRRMKKNRVMRNIAAAAAAVAVFITLPNTSATVAAAMSDIPIVGKLVEVVTFRDYQYESDSHSADVEVPELVADSTELINGTENAQVHESLKKTTDEINAEIQKITDDIVAEFQSNIDAGGYQDIMINKEILTTTEEYFTLKLICYQGAGSGAEWDYFYTIDLKTGERLALKDLFVEGADYITPISENIKAQMREQMAADEMVHYWVDETDEMADNNFQAITDETSFYVNGQGQIVIAFDEYDVAPGYMGTVEFVIPDEVTANIRK